jgi:hypothetical protein
MPPRPRRSDGALEDVEGLAGVAGGEPDEVLECVVGDRHAARRPEVAGQAALLVGERPPTTVATCSSVSGSRR